MKQITNNKDLLSHFNKYDWSARGLRARWMIVLTVRGQDFTYYSNSKETAAECLNDLAQRLDRRFFNRLFMESKGDLYSIRFERIARGSLGDKVLYTVGA